MVLKFDYIKVIQINFWVQNAENFLFRVVDILVYISMGNCSFIKRITVFDILFDIFLYVERWKECFCLVFNREDFENIVEIEME